MLRGIQNAKNPSKMLLNLRSLNQLGITKKIVEAQAKTKTKAEKLKKANYVRNYKTFDLENWFKTLNMTGC